MAGLLGKVDAFDPELEDWPQYVEWLEHFFEANGIVGDVNAAKRRATFLSVIGPAPYKLIRSLLSPELSGDNSPAIIAHHRRKLYKDFGSTQDVDRLVSLSQLT